MAARFVHRDRPTPRFRPCDRRALIGSFGPKLKRFAVGDDDRPLELGDELKRISSENTFLRDTADRQELRACLREQAKEISARLKRKQLGAQTVPVKVRYGDFTTLTRQLSVDEPLTEARDIYRLGCYLLGKEKLVSRPVRLIGLGVVNLGDFCGRQLHFDCEPRTGSGDIVSARRSDANTNPDKPLPLQTHS